MGLKNWTEKQWTAIGLGHVPERFGSDAASSKAWVEAHARNEEIDAKRAEVLDRLAHARVAVARGEEPAGWYGDLEIREWLLTAQERVRSALAKAADRLPHLDQAWDAPPPALIVRQQADLLHLEITAVCRLSALLAVHLDRARPTPLDLPDVEDCDAADESGDPVTAEGAAAGVTS